ncbi:MULTISPECIES: hypothetical protein [unclassified Haematospirillum]|uniref:capsular polysaccharide export protein, LipB/KpsS family n=1 Tax=unclassified Haematospirillum TaxID=2622088 RepID=UPI0014394464|nr:MULTISPECIES: hypothetical protein [unclassified Haematospirillum]NKD56038.1 hypothetical protein [Haematospirillum sp. H4890]NKD76041.1 hypothetical protein [Haematospirillum sp. H4485]
MEAVLCRLRRLVETSHHLRAPLMLLRKLWRDRRCIGRIAIDLLETYRATNFLRLVPVTSIGRTLNLYAVDDDSIYGLKLMAFISQALRLEGWQIQVVLRNRSMILGRAYFRAFGIRRFAYLEDHCLADDERAFCGLKAQEFLDGPLSLQGIKAWTFEGCWIGPQIISTLSRIRFEGSVDFTNPEVRRCLRGLLVSTLEHVLRARKLIEQHPADLALTIEANYAVFGPLVDVAICHGCNVIQMVQPWKDDALTFRRITPVTRRDHPSSVARNTLDFLVLRPWTDREQQVLDQMFKDRYGGRWFLQERNQCNTRYYTPDELTQRFRLDRAKPTAVVFSQVLWDANLFYGDDLFEDAGEWFVETVRAACANPALNWLIKLHPANVWKRKYEGITQEYAEQVLIDRSIGTLPDHVMLIAADDDISTLSLFEFIDYGVTVRGTSGMELVCFGKHCVTAGTGRYSGLGFTLDSTSRQQYLQRLACLHKQAAMNDEEILRAKWHAYAAFALRLWPMLSAKAEFMYRDQGRDPMDHNLRLVVDSIDELLHRGDLAAWGRWAEGDAVDFVCHQPELAGSAA